MRKILCSPSFTFDSAQVRTASELGLKYQNFRSSLIAYSVHRAFNQSRTNAQYNYLVCDLWEQAFPVHVGNFSLSLTREPPTQMLSGYSRRFQRERNWEWVRKIRSRGREWSERNLYIFLQRRRFLSSIWSSLCISVFQTSFFLMDYERRDNSKEAYLRIRIVILVDSIKPVLGTCQKEVLIIIGSHVTFGAPRERGMSGGVR